MAERAAKPFASTRILALGFAALIALGTLLLSLPASSADGQSIGVGDALFMATSSVCVTGLAVRDAGTELSRLGQVFLLLLVQAGGLGFMTLGTMAFLLLGRRVSLRGRLLIQESMNADGVGGMVRLIRWAVLMTLCVEACGALVLAIRFVPMYGLGEGLFQSLFCAVSSFCNAGFDLTGGYRSLLPFAGDPLVLFTVMALITTGGIGFAVGLEVWRCRRFSKLSVHARLVLIASGALLLFGTLCTLLLEWNNENTLGGMDFGGKLMNALFQSVTLRTAGFCTVDQAALRPATKLISCALMFVGASPASTGGGVKVTTFCALSLMLVSTARGREDVVLMGKSLPRSLILRAMTVFLIALGTVLVDVVLLAITEPGVDALSLVFEAFSAFGTVGLSCSVTGGLSAAGRAIVIVTMFIGRVGPLTLALAIARRQAASRGALKYPETKIMIG